MSSNIIYALTHEDLNLRDGGFTTAKMITEFGVAGLVLIIIYLAVMIRCIMMLRRLAGGVHRYRTASSSPCPVLSASPSSYSCAVPDISHRPP